ncbi:MAG: hypothetical protein IKU35_06605 [Bacteroidaceae bacterium]|nr:hypothetical protein [Bacteroidaceae bacterium]
MEKLGIVTANDTFLVCGGEYIPYKCKVFRGGKVVTQYRAKVFSVTDHWFDSDYHDIYNVHKDAYVKNNRGRKYYLKNAQISIDRKTIYV